MATCGLPRTSHPGKAATWSSYSKMSSTVRYTSFSMGLLRYWVNCGSANPGIDNGFSMSIGTGIGGGLVVDGRVLHGAHGLSGMATSGLLRESAGLESIASGPAVAAASGVASGSEAVQQCRRRDARAVKAFASASQALYEAVATVTATVDVTTVIVAGGFGAAGFDLLFPERAIPAKYRWYPLVHDDVEVIPAVTGELAPLLGAVKYAILQECSKG